MSGRRILRAAAVLTLAAAIATGGDGTVSPARAVPTEGALCGAIWRGAGMGESLGGSACWLRGPADEVRIEVTRAGDASRADASPAWGRLLTRGGEGWVVLLAPDAAVGARWGAPLERLGPASRLRLETLLALLEGGGERDGPWPAGVRVSAPRGGTGRTPDAFRLQLPETAPLRAALESRGRGRGGGGETWRIRRGLPPDAAGAPEFLVTSTRMPGRLSLRAAGTWPVRFEPDDVFVPVWSLGELLTFPAARPGAAGPETEADSGRP